MSMFSKRREKPRVEACLHSRILMTRVCLLEGSGGVGVGRGQMPQWDHVCRLTPGLSGQTFVLVCHQGTIQAAGSPQAGAGVSLWAVGGYF